MTIIYKAMTITTTREGSKLKLVLPCAMPPERRQRAKLYATNVAGVLDAVVGVYMIFMFVQLE